MYLPAVILVIGIGVVYLNTANALSCYSCDGDQCASSASLGQQVDCNGVDDKCYTQFSGYKPIKRGCVSELAAECTGENCDSCTTDFCNVYSKAGHTCVVCSSVTDPQCISDPNALQVTKCGATSLDVANYQCYSRVRGSVTERGCVQSQTDLDVCDGLNCETCAAAGCNAEIFPKNRQKCVKCDGGNECNIQTATSYCELHDDNCVTVLRSAGTYLKTCESSMAESDAQLCESKQSSCSYCGKLECNKAVLNSQSSRKCYDCEGTNCLRTSLAIKSCHTNDDECFSIFGGYNPVQRGCRTALNTQDKARCDDAEDISCDLCSNGDVCNLNSREDHMCQYCSSAIQSNCVSAPNNPVQCPAPSTEVSDEAQCYTRIIGGITERGCLGSAADELGCNAENCQTCAGKACNGAAYPANWRKCAVGTLASQNCPRANDNCVQMQQNGIRTKKCESAMSNEEKTFCKANSNFCQVCAGDNCNQQNVTFDYLECISCSSATDPKCVTQPSTIANVEKCQTCAMLQLSSGALKRACLTSLSDSERNQCTSASSTDQTCKTCTTNRCNAVAFPTNRLACYTCSKGSCFSHDTIVLEYCASYQENDVCFAERDIEGNLIRMGCKSALSAAEQSTCSSNPQLCRFCSQTQCNDPFKFFGEASCIQCSSASDPSCIGEAAQFDAEPCNDPRNTQCYSRLVSNSVTERGCMTDLDASSIAKCVIGSDCAVCASTGAKCNQIEYPTGQIRCHQCSSTQDASCKETQSGNPTYCSAYNTANKCYVIVAKDGTTVRKCSTSPRSVECAGSERCEVCSFSGCNKRTATDVMPTNATTGTTTTAIPPTKKPNSAMPGALANGLTTMALMMLILIMTANVGC